MPDKSIQLFMPTFRVEECLEEIRKCLEMGWTGLGFRTNEFEEAWKYHAGVPNAHFLNSATAGLHLAIKIFKENYHWADEDEVITTPITFVSTNHAIKYERLNTKFADIDQYGCLDPESVESAITPRTRAVIFVGLGGNTGQLQKISELCRAHNIKLILDAAHMAGSRIEGQSPARYADVTVYSFQAVKNLPTADSGMICFTNEKLDKVVRQQSWLGIDKDTFSRTHSSGSYKWYYDVPYLGYKYHGNSIMASIGLVQLKYLDPDNAYRRQICAWYDELIDYDLNIQPVTVAPNCESSRHLYQILLNRRDEVLLALNNAGVFPGVHYRDNTQFTMYEDESVRCPRARDFSDRVISLPLHLRLSRQDVEYISASLNEIVSRNT